MEQTQIGKSNTYNLRLSLNNSQFHKSSVYLTKQYTSTGELYEIWIDELKVEFKTKIN